ncbi:MAG: MATE family efflux transporter [Bacteroidales bacterium]|nr:MATE family efflux transporter [Bacteroidales bacterium]MDD4771715.1 MATE family efflux transporter [Bacteroidales bacterium]
MTQSKYSPLSLGTERIGKLLAQYAIPAIIAMTASSLYNITDSVFIGHGVGALAISGLALTFPVMNLAAAFGSLVGAGASALMSVRLGQKDYDTANKVLGNVFVLNIVLGLLFTLIMLFFLKPTLYFFGASDATLPYAYDYLKVILYGNVITHMYMGLNALLRSSGHPKKSMYATIGTVVLNLILTPLFIYQFGWGIQGSAWATVLSQALMLVWQISIFSNKKHFIHLKKGVFKLKKKIVLDSLSIGLSPFFMNAAASVIVIFINQGLSRYGGDMAVGAYGIVNRVVFLFAMIVLGLNQGMQPIAGYNYGAQQYDRVDKVLKMTIFYATGVMFVGFLIGQFFPSAVASVFTTDEQLIEHAVRGLRIVMIFFPIIGFQMVTSNFFQSIGKAHKAIFLSLTRQMIFLLPCLIIFPQIWGVNGVWYSLPVADLASSVVAGIVLFNQLKQFRRAHNES